MHTHQDEPDAANTHPVSGHSHLFRSNWCGGVGRAVQLNLERRHWVGISLPWRCSWASRRLTVYRNTSLLIPSSQACPEFQASHLPWALACALHSTWTEQLRWIQFKLAPHLKHVVLILMCLNVESKTIAKLTNVPALTNVLACSNPNSFRKFWMQDSATKAAWSCEGRKPRCCNAPASLPGFEIGPYMAVKVHG